MAGNAFDGEAPFGEHLLGRSKRAGSAEEADARVPSRTFYKDTNGEILCKVDKATHYDFNFTSPKNSRH